MEVDFKHSLLRDQDQNILIPATSRVSNCSPDDALDKEEIQLQIAFLRRRLSSLSFVTPPGSQTTFGTALVITNNTLGTAVMILPIVFGTCGILNSLIAMILIGLAQFVTCRMCIVHLKDNEPDLPQITERILGKTWKAIFVISSSLFEFLVGIVYVILMNNMIYSILIFFFKFSGFEGYAQKDENRYDVFSFQILSWILIIPCFLSCFMKNIDLLATLGKIGIYVLCGYIVFLFYIFTDNICSGQLKQNFNEINYFTDQVSEVSGAFSLAFFIHSAVCPLIKPIQRKEESVKALGISFVLSAFFYFMIGLIGYLGIIGRQTIVTPQTIMDFFPSDSILPFIMELIYFLKLVTVFPLFCYISRTQLFALLFIRKRQHLSANDAAKPPEEETRWIPTIIFNLLYIAACQFCVLYNVNLTFIMGLTGSVFGFLLVFIIPVALHLKCYGSKPVPPSNRDVPNPEERLAIIEKFKCNDHPDKDEFSLWLRALFYIVIVLFGIYLMVIQLRTLFN